jgi:CRISPR-associated protein Csb2
MDVVARAWSRGSEGDKGDADPRTHRTMKTVRPMWLRGDTVHFLWPADPRDAELDQHRSALQAMARSVSALGWGVDLVVGDLAVVSDPLSATLGLEAWSAEDRDADDGLRVPVDGSLAELRERYQSFTERIAAEGFTAPPPPSRFRVLDYRRSTDPAPRAVAAFALLQPDKPGFRAFDAPQKALTLVGMMRHATAGAARASGWSEARIAQWVLGHAEARGAEHVPVGPERFAYLPLPSIEARGGGASVVGPIRRVMLTSFAADAEVELNWARQTLPAQELVDERSQNAVALLSSVPAADRVLQRYMQSADSWVTVTPVVLPGYDDPDHLHRRAARAGVTAEQRKKLVGQLADRIERLIRKAIAQSGISMALADSAGVEWRKVPFVAGAAHADRYGVPPHLKRFARYHVRLQFRDAHGSTVAVPGPLCIGGGRYFGLGLFVAEP